MARVEVSTFRVIFHSSRISYSQIFVETNIFFFLFPFFSFARYVCICASSSKNLPRRESCKTIQEKLLIGGGNEVKKLTCGEVSSELDIRVLRFPKNVWKQELGQGKYEISFMVKRGRRKVMSTVLRNY